MNLPKDVQGAVIAEGDADSSAGKSGTGSPALSQGHAYNQERDTLKQGVR